MRASDASGPTRRRIAAVNTANVSTLIEKNYPPLSFVNKRRRAVYAVQKTVRAEATGAIGQCVKEADLSNMTERKVMSETAQHHSPYRSLFLRF